MRYLHGRTRKLGTRQTGLSMLVFLKCPCILLQVFFVQKPLDQGESRVCNSSGDPYPGSYTGEIPKREGKQGGGGDWPVCVR